MKYLFSAALLLAGSMTLQAADNDSIATHTAKDPLYLQLYGGINKSANENLPWMEFSRYPWSGGMFVGMGQELSSLWGWRAAFRFDHNKSRNVQHCEYPDTWGWNNLGLFADATFDITDALRAKGRAPFNKARHSHTSSRQTDKQPQKAGYNRWNVKAFAGLGAAYTFAFDSVALSYQHPYNRSSQLVGAVRVGLTATYQFARNWRVGAELSHTMYTDNFNGVRAAFPSDGRTNLKVGITYLISKKRKTSEPIGPIPYDTRLRTVPALPFALPAEEGEKVRRIAGRAFIDFVVDKTDIRPSYRRNSQELQRMTSTIDSVLFDKTIKVDSIYLHGYASPESPYAHNDELSRGRVQNVKEYLRKRYNFGSTVFQLKHTAEDWGNLRDFIAEGNRVRTKGDIWYESKAIHETPETPDYVLAHQQKLLAVIDSTLAPDAKEEALKKVDNGRPYRWLYDHVYPGLRHTDYVIVYTLRHYPVKEAKSLIYTHPEALSLNEMYQVANSYLEGSDEWLDALLIAARQYPDDETANLNAACACVQVKRLTDAKRYLAKAGRSEAAKEVKFIISAMEGTVKWQMKGDRVVPANE